MMDVDVDASFPRHFSIKKETTYSSLQTNNQIISNLLINTFNTITMLVHQTIIHTPTQFRDTIPNITYSKSGATFAC